MADAKYRVKVGDSTYMVTAPDANTAWQWANMTHEQKLASAPIAPAPVEEPAPEEAPASKDVGPAMPWEYFTDREAAIQKGRAFSEAQQAKIQRGLKADIATNTGLFDFIGDLFSSGLLNIRSGAQDVAAAIEQNPEVQKQFQARARQYAKDAQGEVAGALTTEDVTKNWLKALPFALQEFTRSAPYLAAMPIGAASLAGTISRSRTEADGKEDVGLKDLAIAAPFAVVSTILDRFGLGELIGAAGVNAAVRTLKAAVAEGSTEGIQNTIEYLGGRVGTEKGVEAKEALEQALWGALVGAGAAGTLRGTGELATAPFRRKREELPAEIDPEVRQEFNRLAAEEVVAAMGADFDLTQDEAVRQVAARSEELLAAAKANVVARETEAPDEGLDTTTAGGAGATDLGAGVDVTGGLEPSVPSARAVTPTPPVVGEPAAVVEGGVGEPRIGVPVPAERKGVQPATLTVDPVLAPVYAAPNMKERKSVAMQIVSDIVMENPDLQGLPAKTYGSVATQVAQRAARNEQLGVLDVAALLKGRKISPPKMEVVVPEPTLAAPIPEVAAPIPAPASVLTEPTSIMPPAATAAAPTQAPVANRAQALIDKLYTENEKWPGQGNQFVFIHDQKPNGEVTKFTRIELLPYPSKNNDVAFIDWISTFPTGEGLGGVALEQLKKEATAAGVSLRLNPWDQGRVSKGKLTKFYKKHGFKKEKGSEAMVWSPETARAETAAPTPAVEDLRPSRQSIRDEIPAAPTAPAAPAAPKEPLKPSFLETLTPRERQLWQQSKASYEATPDAQRVPAYTHALHEEGIRSVMQGKAIPTRQELEDAVGAYNADYFEQGVQAGYKQKFIGRMKKAPGKTARQKLFAMMSEERAKELKGKSGEELAEALGAKPYDPNYDEIIIGKAGVNKKRIVDAQRQKYKGDPDTMTGVVIKELLQNSHDATRTAMELGQITLGKIQFNTDKSNRTITIIDNGQGMTGEILAGPFLELGSTGKTEGKHSGGFGMAKALLLYGSEKIDVITARDGKVATLDTRGEDLAQAAYENDPDLQPRIRVRDFTPEDYDLFPEGHGTIVNLTMPEEDTDPYTGNMVRVRQLPDYYMYGLDSLLDGAENSPLFADTVVTYNGKTMPIGANFPFDEWKVFARAKLPFGVAHIYVSKKPSDFGVCHILSDGVWQFESAIRTGDNQRLPHNIYINFIPFENIKPDSSVYPFNEQRKAFSDAGEKAFSKIASLLKATYGVRNFLDEVKSFGNIQYYDPATGKPGTVIDLMPEIPQDVIDRIEQGGAPEDSDIEIGEDGRVKVNGNDVDTESIDSMQSNLPKVTELIIDQDKIKSDEVMLHDAADVIIEDLNTGTTTRMPIVDYMRDKFGSRVDEYFNYVGSKFIQLRKEVVDAMEQRYPGRYQDLLTEAMGISLDPSYRGVSVIVPFSGMFLNPLVPESLDPHERLEGIITTMIHELAHYRVRDHNAGFPAEMQRIYAALKAAKYKQGFDFNRWSDQFVADIIDAGYGDIIDAGQYLFATQEDRDNGGHRYTNPKYTNTRVVYRGGRLGNGSPEQISDGRAEGQGAASDTGITGGRGSGAEPLLRPTYEGREGAGKRGKRTAGDEGGTEPIDDATVDKAVSIKLTKAQIKRLEEAAGIRQMKLNAMQKRIARSRSGNETMSLAGKLMLMARNRDEDVGLLASLFNSTPPTVLQKLLGPLMTEDVVRLGERAGLKTPTKIDTMMRDGYIPYVNRMMHSAGKVAEAWADFTSRFEQGARALADVIFITNMHDVDPTLAPTAGEYMKIDRELKNLQAALKNQTDPKKRSNLEGQIATRRGEIQRVYFGGTDPKTNEKIYGWNAVPPEGKKLFRMVRDEYRKTFEEHYRILMQRINDAKLDKDDAVRLKKAVNAMFAKASERMVYFPLRRFGDYWVTVGKGASGEFHMFESASEQAAFVAQLRRDKEERNISSGYGRDTLRKQVTGKDASTALKSILDMIDEGNIEDIDALKDHIFQMYLTALPEADMRRRFIHRQFKAGFSTDVLRTFASTSIASATQLGRLAYKYKLDNLIDEGYSETEGMPSKNRLDTIVRELEMRVNGTLSPDPENSIDWWLSLGAKATFLFLLSSPKSAIMNLTQLHIGGLPVLSAEFGEAKTSAMALRYSGSFLTGKRIANPFRDAEGNVSLQIPNITLEESSYIRGLKDTDPDRYEAIQKAWEYDMAHDVTQSTFASSSDIYERSNKPTDTYGFVQSVRRGDMITAAQRGAANAMNALGTLFHNSERIGRQIMYMSAFELAYERALKQGKTAAEATEIAIPLAAKLTNKGMFDFSNWNKSRYSKSQVGRLPLQMRSYSLAMVSLLFRSFVGMLPLMNKEGKLASARVFMGMGIMTTLYGGLRASQFYIFAQLGLGLYEFLKDALGGEDDEDKEKEIAGGYLTEETIERELLKYADTKGRELSKKDMDYYIRSVWIPETFGPEGTMATALGISPKNAAKLAKVADMGLPAYFGVDISNSVSMGDLWHPVDVKSDDPEVAFYERLGRYALGPSGALFTAPIKAVKAANEGNFDKAIEVSMPAAIRGYVKAERLKDEGLRVGKNRDIVLKDPSFYDTYTTVMQSLGFTDADTSRAMELDIKAGEIEKEVSAAQTKLLDRRYRAIRDFYDNPSAETQRAWNEVERDIDVYNLNYPSNEITEEDKEKSFQGKSSEAMERSYGLGYNEKIPVRQPLVEERLRERE